MEIQNKFIDPEKVIDQIDLREGSVVADFGCGTGYFSFPISKRIGDRGVLYSLDVLPQIIEVIESQAKVEGLKNIVTKRVNFEKAGGSKLADGLLDWVIIKDVLYQNKEKATLLAEAKRVLKKGGKALIVEWKKEGAMIGPEMDLRVEKSDVLKMASDGGWEVLKEVDAGKVHYGIILIK